MPFPAVNRKANRPAADIVTSKKRLQSPAAA